MHDSVYAPDRTGGAEGESAVPKTSYETIAHEYFYIGPADLETLGILGALTQDVKDRLIDNLYNIMATWDEAREVVSNLDLQHVKEAQREYFAELFSGKLNAGYIARRTQIGATHDRFNIPPMWYMAAYSFYLLRLFEHVIPRLQERPVEVQMRVFSALTKIVLFDVGVAWEGYRDRRDQRIQQAERAAVIQQNAIVAELKRMDEGLTKKMESWAQALDSVLEPPRASLGPNAAAQLMRVRSEVQQAFRDLRGRSES